MSLLLDPLRQLFDATPDGPDETVGPDEGARPGDDRAGVDVSLYACDNCDRVYISEGMDGCSGCGRPVERIPDETELGLSAD